MRPNCFFDTVIRRSSVVVMRHAESTWNAPRIRVQGQSRDSNIVLTDKGRHSIRANLSTTNKPTVLITSPLLRCIQTAEMWFDVPFDKIPIQTVLCPNLMEINAGRYEGRWLDELNDDPLWKQWTSNPQAFPGFPGGETLAGFTNRVTHCMTGIYSDYRDSNHQICIITHGIVMRVIKCILANQPTSSLWQHTAENLERLYVSTSLPFIDNQSNLSQTDRRKFS